MEQGLTEVFCKVDDFCQIYLDYYKKHALPSRRGGYGRMPRCVMSLSEMMTITIWFHLSGYRNFKWYYRRFVNTTLKPYFPRQLSYNRFVEIMPSLLAPLVLYLNQTSSDKCTGISYIDSTTLKVCHPRRIHSHKVFNGIAQRGKSSTGWFYGFKLHLVINDRGEILSFCLTRGNADDRDHKTIEHLSKGLFGKLFGDKGYLSKKLFEQLRGKGITLFTKLKKNMKNKLMEMPDKLLLRKRAVIESVNDFLKNICQIEQSRHRSPRNFLVNLISGLVAYSFLPKKPSLHILRNQSSGNALALLG